VRTERVPVQLLSAQCGRVIPNRRSEVAHNCELLVLLAQTLDEFLKVKPEMTPPAFTDTVVQIEPIDIGGKPARRN
jgi:hypothetical protein